MVEELRRALWRHGVAQCRLNLCPWTLEGPLHLSIVGMTEHVARRKHVGQRIEVELCVVGAVLEKGALWDCAVDRQQEESEACVADRVPILIGGVGGLVEDAAGQQVVGCGWSCRQGWRRPKLLSCSGGLSTSP